MVRLHCLPDPTFSHSQRADPTAALILGCGFLGRELACQLLKQGSIVWGTTRHPDRAATLARLGVRPLLLDLHQSLTFASLTPVLDAPALQVYYLIPPGRLRSGRPDRASVLAGIQRIRSYLNKAAVQRGVLASSSGVYSVDETSESDPLITAESPAVAHDERGALLLDLERSWVQDDARYRIVRLAGLYGPGRVIGHQALLQQAPLLGDPQAWLNLIHRDDAAALLRAVAERPEAGAVELGADGRPIRRLAYYSALARQLGVQPPRLMTDTEVQQITGIAIHQRRQSRSKRLDPTSTRLRTGWKPRHPEALASIAACLNPRNP